MQGNAGHDLPQRLCETDFSARRRILGARRRIALRLDEKTPAIVVVNSDDINAVLFCGAHTQDSVVHAIQLNDYAKSPLDREHITQPLVTGVRAIDGLLPCGKGQRIGIFGGSGVGKSTLLGSMARDNSADVTVIGMIGERNREVRAFLEQELGPKGRERSVVVCATSERPAPLRVRACFVALAVAEYFRDQGPMSCW